jgi:hypothetical protein
MRDSFFRLKSLAAMATCMVCLSCGIFNNPTTIPRAERKLYGWHDDGGSGKVSIRISLPDQIAEIERGGRPIGWCYVATGKEGHGTKAGTYKITEKIEDKYSNRYGWIEDEFGNVVDGDAKPSDPVSEGMLYVPAPMPYWMRLTSYGIGMHGGLIPEPGKPASHGCIRLPKTFVPLLYDSVSVGTPVTITNVSHKRREPLMENPVTREFTGNQRVIESRPLTDAEARRLAPLRAGNVPELFDAY